MPRRSLSLLVPVLALLLGPPPASAARVRVAHATAPAPIVIPAAHAGAAGGVPVTMAPAGLSIEYPVLASYMAGGPCPPPALAAELARLGSPPMRIGGDSQDLTVPAGAAPDPAESWRAATLYPLPAGFWESLKCLLASSHDAVTVGVNAFSGNLAWAQSIVAGAEQAVRSGLAFSIGNEPDLYPLPNYASLGMRTVDEAAAVQIYLRLLATLRPAVGSAPIVGPDLARTQVWRPWLPLVLAHTGISTVGVHVYPLSGCVSPRDVTLPGLLSSEAAQAPARLRWVVAVAAAAHVPAIVSEANSASCGGRHGVSDAPGAAVWAVRFAVNALLTGFREVRFHMSGGWYDPFVMRGNVVVERPLASAIAALNRWLPIGSILRPLAPRRHVLATQVAGPGPAHLILDNRTVKPQQVIIPGSAPVAVQLFSATRTGVTTVLVRLRRGRLSLTLPGESVAAVL